MLKRQEQLEDATYRIATINLRHFCQTVYNRKNNLEIPKVATSNSD